MSDISEQEKRRFHRFRHADSVQFELRDFHQMTGCLSRDLSEGGVRVRLNHFVPLYTEMPLLVRLTDDQMVECSGRVVWIEQARYGDYYFAGIKFTGEQTIVSQQQKIRAYLSHQEGPDASGKSGVVPGGRVRL